MFQNITKNWEDEEYEDVEFDRKAAVQESLKQAFSMNKIVLYVLSFMLSMVGVGQTQTIVVAPFAIAVLAAAMSNQIPIGILYLVNAIGVTIKFGSAGLLNYLFTTLVFFVSTLLIRPNWDEDANEGKKLAKHIFISTLIVQLITMAFHVFLVYDLLVSIAVSLIVLIFYKIFSNSLIFITEFEKKKAFSIEEVMGGFLFLAIAVVALGDIRLWGFSIRNILSILFVLILGWKHGMVVGATSGITIGSVSGILCGNEVAMIALYAISGMIAGILNRFGKIGVVLGFFAGMVMLTYVANGYTIQIVPYQEVLLASLGLLFVPKRVKIHIEDLYGTTKLLPEMTGRSLEENQETIQKLTSMSETISDIAKGYETAAEGQAKEKKGNLEIFIQAFEDQIEATGEDNDFIEYFDQDEEILQDCYHELVQNEIITGQALQKILEAHKYYFVSVGERHKNPILTEQIDGMVRMLNRAYRNSKTKFLIEKKTKEDKKNLSNELNHVSKAIADLAKDIQKETTKEEFVTERKEIQEILRQKEIPVSQVEMKQYPNNRRKVKVYTMPCEDMDGKECDIKRIGKVVAKALDETMVLQDQVCGIRDGKEHCEFTYLAQDRYHIQVGIASTKKADSPISGDTSTQIQLEDGKYLLAISDGMGSGPEARKNSKVAIKILERSLKAGFEKDLSVQSVNSAIYAGGQDQDMYATLDVGIMDLYAGKVEFMKHAACPTYLKRKDQVRMIQADNLPTGILPDIQLDVYEQDLEDGDLFVMCSDGVIEADKEYLNKEVWVKYLLEDMNLIDAQKIADIILSEAVDKDYGKEKDDMTVVVARVTKK